MGVLGFMRGFHGDINRSKTLFHSHCRCIQRRSLSNSEFLKPDDDSTVPVVIVGAGPVGLVLSILLTKLGIKCTVLEKNNAFSNHPQAHFINNRSMEVFRKMDGLAEDILKSQAPVDLWRKFIYCSSLTGPIFGSVDHMQPQDFENVVSPVSVTHFSQYKLSRLLLKKLEALKFKVYQPESLEGPKNKPIIGGELLMGHECVSFNVTGQSVTVTAAHLNEGKYKERCIRCNILVGTDGAGSSIRRLAKIELSGEQDLQKLVSVHFLSRDLGSYLLNERPGMLFFIFNTEAIGVLVAHDLKQGEFVLQMPFYPPQQTLGDFNPKMCKKLIFKLVGRELSDITVVDIKPWVMHAEVAEKFVTCENRIILAGDAAHRFPPAGGFGMNTGIQDAHNLAWKIASLVHGIAPYSLLHTYETERRPVAIANTELSVKNFQEAMAVPAALGLDPSIASSVHKVITNGIGSVLPPGLQRAVLDGIFSVGRAQLSEYFLNDKNPFGSTRLANLRRIFQEGKSLQLQFPAEDLGFRYAEGAVIPDSNSTAPPKEEPAGRRREYIPSSDPGSRLPHMDVRILSRMETVSTHDLLSGDKIEFLLVIAPLEKSYDLARSTIKVSEEFKVSTKICILWAEDTDFEGGTEARSAMALSPWRNYVDAVEVRKAGKPLSWWEICQMSEEGAILVRPDEHIAWRSKSGVNEDPVSKMRKVFSNILQVAHR